MFVIVEFLIFIKSEFYELVMDVGESEYLLLILFFPLFDSFKGNSTFFQGLLKDIIKVISDSFLLCVKFLI